MDRELHVVPVNDLVEHQPDENCWCDFEVEQADGGEIIVHRAVDGRD